METITVTEVETLAQEYAEYMLSEIDKFNAENPLPEGKFLTTETNREELLNKFKQLLYLYVAERKVIIP